MVHCVWAAMGRARLDPQLAEERFQVGFVDQHFRGRLAVRWDLDSIFIEGLEEAHFGDGIFLTAREGAAVLLGPGLQGGALDEDLEREGGAAVYRNDIGKFSAWTAPSLGAIPFEKVILIDIAVCG